MYGTLAIVSVKSCGKCMLMKGDGLIYSDTDKFSFSDDRKWNEYLMKKLLCGSEGNVQKIRVREFIFEVNEVKQSNLSTLVQYDMVDGHPVQIIYRDSGKNTTEKITYTHDKNVKNEIIDIPISDSLNNTVPQYLSVYVSAFPGWVLMNDNDYMESCKPGKSGISIRGWALGYHHVKHSHQTFIDHSKLKEYNMPDPVDCVDLFLKNKNILNDLPKPKPLNSSSDFDIRIKYTIQDVNENIPFTNGTNYRIIPDDLLFIG